MSRVLKIGVDSEERLAGSSDTGFMQLVIVSPACDRFDEFIAAGRRGDVGLHFCVDGRSALRLARHFRADLWLVAVDLPDMAGLDLLEMILPSVAQSGVDPFLAGTRATLVNAGEGLRSGVFIVAETYCFEDEQRALRSGAAAYVAGPVSLDLLREARCGAGGRTTATLGRLR